jgi:hypothetical protein
MSMPFERGEQSIDVGMEGRPFGGCPAPGQWKRDTHPKLKNDGVIRGRT